MSDRGDWWVAQVKPRHEKAFASDLARKGLGYYLPLLQKRVIRPDNGKARKSIVCVFPGYLPFTGYREQKEKVFTAGHVIKVLKVVDQDGFIRELENVRKALDFQEQIGLNPGLAVGQTVMIVAGPLAGLRGVVSALAGPGKLFLNVEMFNRSISINISPEQVSSVLS